MRPPQITTEATDSRQELQPAALPTVLSQLHRGVRKVAVVGAQSGFATELPHHLMLKQPSSSIETSECVLHLLAPFSEFSGTLRGASRHLECKADLGG